MGKKREPKRGELWVVETGGNTRTVAEYKEKGGYTKGPHWFVIGWEPEVAADKCIPIRRIDLWKKG
ncbi:MAG TPA: hypothetical protein VN838_12055 [Bradyrhizobium sp.]|nr:hypothetical protein [Bradyrhizobium sp.]